MIMSKSIIPDSELILNPDGSIYHLNLHPEDLADNIITVGDPERVHEVTKHFDKIYLEKSKREFKTVTGVIGNKDISVISTGIGTDNIDIVFNELDTLVNVNLKTRQICDIHKKLNFFRIGTSGTLQENIEVDQFLVSQIAVGLGGLMHFYDYQEPNPVLTATIDNKLIKNNIAVHSYTANSANPNIDLSSFEQGITITLPGFYGPQGRELRGQIASLNYVSNLSSISYKGLNVTNFEMETAGIYGLASYLGHNALSFNAILANRRTNKFSNQPTRTINRLIEKVLQLIVG